MWSDPAEVSIDELTDGEVLVTDEPFKFDLLCILVQVNVNLVFVAKSVVQKHRLDVMLLAQEVMQLCKTVLLTHEEQTLTLKSLLRSHLLLSDCLSFPCSISAALRLLSGLRIQRLQIPRHLKLIKDQLPIDLWPDLADNPRNLEPLMRHFLHGQAPQQLILNEHLLDASICTELETALILVGPFDINLNLVVLDKPSDLLKLSVIAIDQDEVLGLGFDEELLE